MGKGIFVHNYQTDSAIDSVTNGILQTYRSKNEQIDPYTFVDLVNSNTININNNTTSLTAIDFDSGKYPDNAIVGDLDWLKNCRLVKLSSNLFLLHVKNCNWDCEEDRYQAGGHYSNTGYHNLYLFYYNGTTLTYKSSYTLNSSSSALQAIGVREIDDKSWYVVQYTSNKTTFSWETKYYYPQITKVYVDVTNQTFKSYTGSINQSSFGNYTSSKLCGVDIQINGKNVYVSGNRGDNYEFIIQFQDSGSALTYQKTIWLSSQSGASYDNTYYGSQMIRLNDNKFIKLHRYNSSYYYLYASYINTLTSTSSAISQYQLGSSANYIPRHAWRYNENEFGVLLWSGSVLSEIKYSITANNTITQSASKNIANTTPYIRRISDNLTGYLTFYNSTVQLAIENYSKTDNTFSYTPITMLESTSNLFSTFIGYDYIDDDNIIIYGYNSTNATINYCSFGYDGEKINIKTIGVVPGITGASNTAACVYSYKHNDRILFFSRNNLVISLGVYIYLKGNLIMSQVYTLPLTGNNTSYPPRLLDVCGLGDNLLILVRDAMKDQYSYMGYKLFKIPFSGGKYGTLEEKDTHVFSNLENSTYKGVSGGYSYSKARLFELDDTHVLCYGVPNGTGYASLITLTADENFVVNALDTGQTVGLVATTCTQTTKGNVFCFTI